MRRTVFAIVLALMATTLLVAPAVAADSKTHTSQVAGVEVFPGVPGGDGNTYGATFVGKVTGDLSGAIAVSVNYVGNGPNVTGDNVIVGGKWSLSTWRGTIYGTIDSGLVDWPGAETQANVSAVLTVTGGTQKFRGVEGSGTFAGVLDHENLVGDLAPTWGGILTLTLAK